MATQDIAERQAEQVEEIKAALDHALRRAGAKSDEFGPFTEPVLSRGRINVWYPPHEGRAFR